MLTLLALLLLFHCLLWFYVFEKKFGRNRRAIPPLPEAPEELEAAPRVAILVPARNEVFAIRNAMLSLINQDYPNYRIIAIDDRSTDGTSEILAQLELEFPDLLTVVEGDTPPIGWLGKNHALHLGAQALAGDEEYLLFTDADCIHAWDALSRAVAAAGERDLDLLALMPRVVCRGFWENAIFPVLMHLGVLQLDVRGLNDPKQRDIAGIGAFTLLRTDTYRAFGGHESIRSEVIDDMALALRTKQAGGRMGLFKPAPGAPPPVSVRMYTNLPDLVSGFEKNMAAAVGQTVAAGLGACAAILALHLVPMALLLAVFIAGYSGAAILLGVVAFTVTLATGVALMERTRNLLDLEWYAWLLYPAGALLAGAIMLRSTWSGAVRGHVEWRGRVRQLDPQETRLV